MVGKFNRFADLQIDQSLYSFVNSLKLRLQISKWSCSDNGKGTYKAIIIGYIWDVNWEIEILYTPSSRIVYSVIIRKVFYGETKYPLKVKPFFAGSISSLNDPFRQLEEERYMREMRRYSLCEEENKRFNELLGIYKKKYGENTGEGSCHKPQIKNYEWKDNTGSINLIVENENNEFTGMYTTKYEITYVNTSGKFIMEKEVKANNYHSSILSKI